MVSYRDIIAYMKSFYYLLPVLITIGIVGFVLFYSRAQEATETTAVTVAPTDTVVGGDITSTPTPTPTPVVIKQVIKGEAGAKGDQGEMPQGHWQAYCLYPQDEFGFATNDMLKRDDGDCPSGWKRIDLWER